MAVKINVSFSLSWCLLNKTINGSFAHLDLYLSSTCNSSFIQFFLKYFFVYYLIQLGMHPSPLSILQNYTAFIHTDLLFFFITGWRVPCNYMFIVMYHNQHRIPCFQRDRRLHTIVLPRCLRLHQGVVQKTLETGPTTVS